jgi:iron complex outermembrane receptor protein
MRAANLLILAPFFCGSLIAQRVGAPTDDLDKLSVDELFTLQVTSVGRKAQQLSKAPAAVFVLTAEDIRRSGATCIPEALQWVPGLTVLRLDGRSWVVSARGSARLYSDKILVMVDGRLVYTPLFSGVIWDALDVPLENIERIEVVRGPGAVMWGPNAVNGVINIITKKAKATKGVMVSGATGNEVRGAAEARVSVAPSDHLAYHIWGAFDYRTPAYGSPGLFYFNNVGSFTDPSIQNLDTGTARIGFRVESQINSKDQFTLQGDGYGMDRQDPLAYPVIYPTQIHRAQAHTEYAGGSLQGQWVHTGSEGRESELQFTYGRTAVQYPFLSATVNDFTIDYQSRIPLGERHELYWGAGFQQYWDDTGLGGPVSFNPAKGGYRVGDVVVRDEYQLVPSRWMLSAGIRLDYNSYHNVEAQPSVRLLYTPNARQSAWMSVSRAVRIASRMDHDIDMQAAPSQMGIFLFAPHLNGSTSVGSEVEHSVEVGYRLQSGQRWSVDTSLFWSYYHHLRAVEGPLTPTLIFVNGVPELIAREFADNAATGRNYGGEIWGMWQVRTGWRIVPSYSYLNEMRWLPPQVEHTYVFDGYPATLRHQGLLRSQHDLSRKLQLDLMAKVRSHDRAFGVPGALLFDARIGWRPTNSGELSLALQDITDRRILESYPEVYTPAIPIRRTFVIKWTQRF